MSEVGFSLREENLRFSKGGNLKQVYKLLVFYSIQLFANLSGIIDYTIEF